MKLEVGMYCRTEDGIIDQVLEIDKRMPNWNLRDNGWDSIGTFNGRGKRVIKSSYDIIDLIKVGDYVNGEKVVEIFDTKLAVRTKNNIFAEIGIKSIVTKEQFKSIEYRIGE